MLILAFVFINSCTPKQPDWCRDTESKLSWLNSADPIEDAKTAIEKGNLEFAAVNGFAMEIPGIDEEESHRAYSDNNYETIEGTGDDLCSEEHARLNKLAREYASIYNKTLAGAP